MKKKIIFLIESYKIFNPKLLLGLILKISLSSCSIFKKNNKTTKDKKTKQMCYAISNPQF